MFFFLAFLALAGLALFLFGVLLQAVCFPGFVFFSGGVLVLDRFVSRLHFFLCRRGYYRASEFLGDVRFVITECSSFSFNLAFFFSIVGSTLFLFSVFPDSLGVQHSLFYSGILCLLVGFFSVCSFNLLIAYCLLTFLCCFYLFFIVDIAVPFLAYLGVYQWLYF